MQDFANLMLAVILGNLCTLVILVFGGVLIGKALFGSSKDVIGRMSTSENFHYAHMIVEHAGDLELRDQRLLARWMGRVLRHGKAAMPERLAQAMQGNYDLRQLTDKWIAMAKIAQPRLRRKPKLEDPPT